MNTGKIGIDMLDVGKGDAFVVDLYNETGERYVIAIDAGTDSVSERIINHIVQNHGGSVDLVISTHPDIDHIGGLPNMVEKLNVTHLLINDPRSFVSAEKILSLAKSSFGIEEYHTFKSAFDRIDALTQLAKSEGVKVHSIFASPVAVYDWGGWSIYVVGPSENLFKDLWLSDDTVRQWFNSDSTEAILGLEKDKKSLIDDPSVDTKPVNNSSVMVLIEGYGRKYLFTGDAGKRAIREAATFKDLSKLTWLDVPHHGSRRNVDTEIINYFAPEKAYISSPGISKSNGKHPRKAVIRALQNTGTSVYSTCKNGSMYHCYNVVRNNYSTAAPWDQV